SPAYAASKAAILGLTRSFAKYGAPKGVTVNAIAPGIADTPMTQAKDFVYSNSEVPLGRAAKPEEVGEAVLFLASEESGYITGQCIHVNGGMYFG
ncbi:MAG: SDR family oxidoreductase, partial [Treponema sp.]|nr:SDR family oxidoreductase [Treponema sp.]